MTNNISLALQALESLSSSTSTSSSGPLNALLDETFISARERILAGDNPKAVITELQKTVVRAKKDVEKGLKGWYTALGSVGKAVDRGFPSNLASISSAYDEPPLFSDDIASAALDRAVLESLGRRGVWDAVKALEEDTGLIYDEGKLRLAEELHAILGDIQNGDVGSALRWCNDNAVFLRSPPHPSALPYHLHRSVFQQLPNNEAMLYARLHLLPFVPSGDVLQLITSKLYAPGKDDPRPNPYLDGSGSGSGASEPAELMALFRAEFCRRQGWPKEDPMEVAVELGGRGGALAAVEKARKVMGDHLGSVRTWTDLPVEIPLPASRRYHSVFVCPVSKEQATEVNPPKMLTCGHVLASESFNRMLKGGRRSAKCPYCPVETSQSAAQRLYF